jgi:nucleotide-binding universal stress UspA family protein
MFKHILVATDGSDASLHAATLAVNLARVHGAQMTATYVVDPYPYMGVGEMNPLGFQSYMAAAQQMAAKAHAQVSELCTKGGAPVTLQVRLVEDATAANGIIDTATGVGADLIVLGSHGRTGLARLMLGSVATKVVAQSPVPVLVTR